MERVRVSASTGRRRARSRSRRALLKAAGLAPLLVGLPREGWAAEYASAGEALDAIDRFESDVGARLRALSEALPAARAFLSSALSDLERFRAERTRLRERLGLGSVARAVATGPAERDLASLRAAQEALVYAHAESLPALGDALAVQILARHMVELARQLTVIDLWIEAEEQRGG